MAEDVHGVRDVPAVKGLRETRNANLRAQMERTVTSDIIQEGNELKEAAEQNLNVILDLDLDGHVRWVSPTWPDVVGTDIESVRGKPISDVLPEDKSLFSRATEALRQDDSGSKVIRFAVYLGPGSRLRRSFSQEVDENKDQVPNIQKDGQQILDMEAQGILVFDRTTGVESHVSHSAICFSCGERSL